VAIGPIFSVGVRYWCVLPISGSRRSDRRYQSPGKNHVKCWFGFARPASIFLKRLCCAIARSGASPCSWCWGGRRSRGDKGWRAHFRRRGTCGYPGFCNRSDSAGMLNMWRPTPRAPSSFRNKLSFQQSVAVFT